MEGWRNGGKEGREGWRARIAAPMNTHTHTPGGKTTLIIIIIIVC